MFASTTTWCRLVRDEKLRVTRERAYPRRSRIGIRAGRPCQLWHLDLTILRLPEQVDDRSVLPPTHLYTQDGAHTQRNLPDSTLTFDDRAEIFFSDAGDQFGTRALATRATVSFDPNEVSQVLAGLDTDGDAPLELVTQVGGRVLIADVADDRQIGDFEVLIPTPVPGARDIQTGDVDGDGVDDIVVSTGTLVVVFLGVPKSPI